jgi:LuxR family transcriptional regulator, maltose regulon positive regulatory protein
VSVTTYSSQHPHGERPTFGELLRRYRVAAGLSQEALAEQARMSARAISDLERGVHRLPYKDTVAQLATALGLTATERAMLEAAARGPRDAATADDRRQEGPQGAPLLTTKLTIPQTRPVLVPRPRLTDRLHAGLQGPLTLVAAPAGYGKTTLLGAWRATPAGSAVPLAWVSLDAGDNDPVRFWSYVLTALDRIQPGLGAPALALLQSPQPPPIEAVLATLLNALSAVRVDTILALDDYHVIEAHEVHQGVGFLLAHLPAQLHLLLATRADPPLPLAQLRARGAVSEVRSADLRFTPEETAAFLREVMGLQLTAEDVSALEDRTEGWIAGVQLAALSLRGRSPDGVAPFIAAFAGSNRYVVDYLADEVLLQQPEHIQTFLLETAILDRLCASLCAAVTGRDGGAGNAAAPSASQALLAHLDRANLFLIALDDERQWYRYHPLFAEVLRQRLRQTQPDRLPDLHRRAGTWFEQQGLVAEAVQHALAAEDWERAARLIEQSGLLAVVRGQVHTVLGWLNRLPEALVRTRPLLCIVHAVALMYSNQLEAAEARVQDAERCVQADTPADQTRVIRGQAAVTRASIARFSGDLAPCVTRAQQALDLLPQTDILHPIAMVNASHAYLVSGDVTRDSERRAAEVIAPLRASGNLFTLLRSITNLARLQTLQGRLRQAAATYAEALQVPPGPEGLRALVGGPAYYCGLGDLLREWNDFDGAQRHLQKGLELVTGALIVDAETVALGYVALARLQQARGEHLEALATLQEVAQIAARRRFAGHLVARGAAVQAQVWLAQGNLHAAARWAEARGLSAGDDLDFPREAEYLTLARVRIAQARSGWTRMGRPLHDALHLLDRLLQAAEAGARMASVIEILILRALALQAQGNLAGAEAALERALALAEPEGYVRIFADEGAPMVELLRRAQARGSTPAYVARLLAACSSQVAGGAE